MLATGGHSNVKFKALHDIKYNCKTHEGHHDAKDNCKISSIATKTSRRQSRAQGKHLRDHISGDRDE
jgi:hypothetical protein